MLIIALTCFVLSSWPSSGSSEFFDVCSLRVNLYERGSTYMIKSIIKIKILKSLKSVYG